MVPSDCPPGSTPHDPLSGLGPVLGSGKVWFAGMGGPHAVIRFRGLLESTAYTAPYGWAYKLVWEVGPLPVGLVTVRGENTRTHQPLWLQITKNNRLRYLFWILNILVILVL